MNSKFLEDQALLFVCGSMPEENRRTFELVLQCDKKLREFTDSLAEAVAPFIDTKQAGFPSPELKERILDLTRGVSQEKPESLVMSSPQGVVEWVSPAFSELCGYPLEELRGNKLGKLLQGEKTEPQVAQLLREAVSHSRPCRQTILNYHKDGHPYWVEVAITPVIDDENATVCFIAEERERLDLPLP